MKLSEMRMMSRLGILLAAIIVGFAAYGIFSFKVLAELRVNGPLYKDVVQEKDLTGDILPPPVYIIESYLVAVLSLEASPEERKKLFEKLKAFKKDYDSRREFWQKESLEPEEKDRLLVGVHKPASAFYQVAFEKYFPALEKK